MAIGISRTSSPPFDAEVIMIAIVRLQKWTCWKVRVNISTAPERSPLNRPGVWNVSDAAGIVKDSVKFFLIRRPDTFWGITWELKTVCRIQNYQSALNSHIHDRFVIAEGLPDCDGFDAAFMLISNELIDGLVREIVRLQGADGRYYLPCSICI